MEIAANKKNIYYIAIRGPYMNFKKFPLFIFDILTLFCNTLLPF